MVGAAARWRSGYAAACKAAHAGSIPARASMSISDYPPHVQARAKAILDREARRLLDEHLANCADEDGQFHFTPTSTLGQKTCDRCGLTFGDPH